jgi:hypothetical protein
MQQHLRAWDKAHDNAQNRGHTLRKEMDKFTPKTFSETHESLDRVGELEKIMRKD